jgi:hypothetical protein
MVKKSDGSNRFCIDFRKINQVTVFDPEPIPNPQDLFAMLAGSKFFTKFDLTKGYWQLALGGQGQREDSIPYTRREISVQVHTVWFTNSWGSVH